MSGRECCGGSWLCDRNWRSLPRYRALLDDPGTNGQRADFERSILEQADAEDAAASARTVDQ